MTIVPRTWDTPQGVSTGSVSVRRIALHTAGLICVLIGLAVLIQGEAIGLGAVFFGAGHFARARSEQERAPHGAPAAV